MGEGLPRGVAEAVLGLLAGMSIASNVGSEGASSSSPSASASAGIRAFVVAVVASSLAVVFVVTGAGAILKLTGEIVDEGAGMVSKFDADKGSIDALPVCAAGAGDFDKEMASPKEPYEPDAEPVMSAIVAILSASVVVFVMNGVRGVISGGVDRAADSVDIAVRRGRVSVPKSADGYSVCTADGGSERRER